MIIQEVISIIEHTYFICKSSWCINIKIVGEFTEMDKIDNYPNAIKIVDGLWLRFADKPLIENEIFYEGDIPYLIKGLCMVKDLVINNSIYKETIITIHSLQFSVCDFQEEGLIAAIIEWTSVAFGFKSPSIYVSFNKMKNKYIFEF